MNISESKLASILKRASIPYKSLMVTSVTVSIKMYGKENAEKLNVLLRASGFKTNVLAPEQTFDRQWTVGGFIR